MSHWELMGASAPEWFKVGLDVFILPAFYYLRKAYVRFQDMNTKLDILIDVMPPRVRAAFSQEYQRRKAA